MERSFHEIFTDVAKETSINKKSAILQEHDSQGLQIFLRCVFDDKVTWLVPDSKPPYEPNDAPEWDLAETRLEQEALKIGRFIQVDGQTPLQGRELTRTRREQLFIQVLEGLHPTEADLLMSGVNKKIKYKGLTKRVVDKAFPDLI
jgi:hypothetical protein